MAASTSFTDGNTESWNDLPEVALAKIFYFLPDVDKLNMACACKSWCRLFGSPNLWRERRVIFHHLDAEQTSVRERKFIQKYGHYMRKLTLGFGTPTFRSCMLISKAADAYAKTFCAKNDIHLRELDLDHVHMEQHWHFILSRNRLITALCKMLRKQKNLETIYVSGARARLHDGCRILESLARGPRTRTITSVYMEDFFETNVFPWRQNRYVKAMGHFMNIQQLHMNYKYLNAEVLRNLANRLSHSLHTLSLIIEGDTRGVEIASDVWYEFSQKCKRVSVSLYLCTTLFRGNDLRSPFVACIPVSEIYLTSWSRVNETEERLALLLRHIGRTYPATLENFAMFFNQHEHIDRELLYLLNRCTKVSDLCLQCQVSADTAINVMKMHEQKKITLSSLNMTLLGLTNSAWERVRHERDRLLNDISEFLFVGPVDVESSVEESDDDDEEDFDIERLLAMPDNQLAVELQDDEDVLFQLPAGVGEHEDDGDDDENILFRLPADVGEHEDDGDEAEEERLLQ